MSETETQLPLFEEIPTPIKREPIPAYYHTVAPENEEERQHLDEVGSKQEAAILELFQQHERLTPHRVESLLDGHNWLLTSIRRAISNLTDRGYLEKTSDTEMGPYGRRSCFWKLKAQQ